MARDLVPLDPEYKEVRGIVREPYMVGCVLTKRGKSLQIMPKHLISATIEDMVKSYTINLTLFDENFFELEQEIRIFESHETTNSFVEDFTFKWGYIDPDTNSFVKDLSAEVYIKLDNIVPTYEPGGAQLDVSFIGGHQAYPIKSETKPGGTSQDTTQDSTAIKKSIPVAIEDLLKNLAKEYGWGKIPGQERILDPVIEPIKELTDTNSLDSTRETLMRFPKRLSESNFNYLERLAKKCVSIRGVSGYIIYLDRKRYNQLHFHPPGVGKPKRVFKVNPNQWGEVLSFSPQIKLKLRNILGGLRTVNNIIVQQSKEFRTELVQNRRKAVSINSSGELEDKDFVGTLPSNRLAVIAHTQEYAEALVRDNIYLGDNHSFTAELEIVGDCRIQGGEDIEVYFYAPIRKQDGGFDVKQLPSSGRYTITKITHNITGGSYTSSLSLSLTPVGLYGKNAAQTFYVEKINVETAKVLKERTGLDFTKEEAAKVRATPKSLEDLLAKKKEAATQNKQNEKE